MTIEVGCSTFFKNFSSPPVGSRQPRSSIGQSIMMHDEFWGRAMSTYALGEGVSIRMFLLGRLLGGLVILFLLLDGVNRLVPWPSDTEAVDRMGYGSSEALARALGAIAALMMIPPTSILGAIMWTGYLGDIVVTYLRVF
jgi:hypothetical protein